MTEFLGYDHVDTRVRSIAAVEPFYDQLMSALGMPRKKYSYVDPAGEWREPSAEHPYNTVEYYEPPAAGVVARFIGFIEDAGMQPTLTRIAFRVAAPFDASSWVSFLQRIGARTIEPSVSDEYPAVFFEDPSGTKLEVCARRPRVG
ncbi:MAG TPA: VOC family protein [Candidatus Acidoferrales bacterium]|nr:VOC family protein [Candidatus Acidoferrales bacterium]